jgi:hypothetical protein
MEVDPLLPDHPQRIPLVIAKRKTGGLLPTRIFIDSHFGAVVEGSRLEDIGNHYSLSR